MKTRRVSIHGGSFAGVESVDGQFVRTAFIDENGDPRAISIKDGQSLEISGDTVLVDGEKVQGVRVERKVLTDDGVNYP